MDTTVGADRAGGYTIGRILMVLNFPLFMRGARGALEKRGGFDPSQIYTYADGYQAIQALDGLALEGGGIDVLVTEAALPRMGRLELLDYCRKQYPMMPVIVVVGGEPSGVIGKVRSLADKVLHPGVFGYFKRTDRSEMLVNMVYAALAGKK